MGVHAFDPPDPPGHPSPRKRAQAGYDDEQLLSLILDTVDVGICVTDDRRRYLLVNPAYCRMYGYTAEELLGQDCLMVVPPDQRERVAATYQAALSGVAPPAPAEWQVIRKDGERREVSVAGAFLNPAGGERCLVLAVTDVTERKKAEEEQRRLEERYREAQKLESLGVLAGGVAHDFNNLLTAILGYASLAQQEAPAGAPAQGYLDQVLKAGRRAGELCQQLLAYAGRGAYVAGPVDLSRLVREIAALLAAPIPRQVSLSLRLAPDLPPVEGDAAQLRQVVLNLLLNAAEAVGAGPGGITVQTSLSRYDAARPGAAYLGAELRGGEYVALEVTDTGCGMDAATRRRIFEPFFTTKFMGRGLGMAAVLGIVRGHRGGISVASEPGRGTAVRVLFPPAAREHPPAPAARPGGLVLFVDDEVPIRELGEAVLGQAGYQVLLAADGPEALELFRRRHAELAAVVLDLTMPGLGGEEVLRQMRAESGRVPVLLSSGYSEQEAFERFGAGGPAGFLCKPYAPKELLDKVGEVVNSQG
jgi:PAS domain S-box-containing protein